jgi:hypothetical protein
MKVSNQIEYIDINSIDLDRENPRLPESFKEKGISEKDIINWMLEDASLIELMLAIGQNGFFIGEAILVVKNSDTHYTVVEGNRRVSSVKLLNDSSIAEIHVKKINRVLQETTHRPVEIPCIVFEKREDIMQYLGYRHVTGIKAWSLLAKARYLSTLASSMNDRPINLVSRELAKKIGSRSDYVKRLLVGFKIYEIVKDNGFYKIPNLNETTFHFNYIADALRHENIKIFISIDLNSEEPFKNFDKEAENHLHMLIDWFFRKNSQNRPRVYGHSKDLTALNIVLADEEARKYFIEGNSLEDALKYTKMNSDTFHHELKEALRSLKYAHSFIHQIEEHNENDIDVLKEILNLCKTMGKTIQGKSKDEWD